MRAGYLQRNPWVLVQRKLGDDADSDDDVTSRAFTPAAWAVLVAHAHARAPSPSTSRLQWLCAFVSRTGLRSAELLRAQRGHLRRHRGGWVLRVHGKGRKNRLVPVPGPAMEARGLDFDMAHAQTPLLASTLDPLAPVAYSSLYETFTRSALSLDDETDASRGLRAVSRPSDPDPELFELDEP